MHSVRGRIVYPTVFPAEMEKLLGERLCIFNKERRDLHPFSRSAFNLAEVYETDARGKRKITLYG